MMTTNSAHAVQAGVGDRRFYVLDVDDEMAQQRSWFDPMRKDLDEGGDGQFLWLLLNLQLKDFHPRHRPKTAELIDQQYRSADSVSQWASTCIEADGIATAVPYPTTLPLSQTIETASLLSSYTDFCRRQGQRCVDERSFGKALATMFGKDARAPPGAGQRRATPVGICGAGRGGLAAGAGPVPRYLNVRGRLPHVRPNSVPC
jgi:hypothetical protein